MSAAPDSPLARLRSAYQERQAADPARYVDVWDDGELVAHVSRNEDMAAARGLLMTMGAIVNPALAAEIEITPDTLADILASATVGLYVRNPAGELEPLPSESGAPLRFDAEFGKVIGVPEITTPRGAVIAAFTSPAAEDGPPVLDVVRLMSVVTRVSTALVAGRSTAAGVVGKAFAMGNGATPR